MKGSTMTVEPFTHLRPVAGNHANLHNLNAVPVPWLQDCRAGSRCRWGARAAAAPSGAAGGPGLGWFRSGMQVVVLPAAGPAAAQRAVLAGVGF
ncbi:hypothetical protein [Crystallibacter degradans]|uniref:hypothetical protein n=1 Tax=Crystallibacter degradans TaxID=2726743 RepID=UPI00147271C5|nr:hypothetical protein [Arthrobacter sp. SF27]NMR32529.1 hypothetical protein [Arthrobacter sp. SF27]